MSHSNSDQTIFNLAPFPMWIYDLDSFCFLAVNQEAIRVYGYSETEFLDMTIKDIRPAEDIPKLEKAVKEAKWRTELYKESLFRHKKRDGSIMYVKIKSNLINFKGKNAEIVTAIDLTHQQRKEAELRLQKQYLATIKEISQLLLKSDNWLKSLNECFNLVGKVLEIDRVYYFENNTEQLTTSQKIEWVSGRADPQINNPELQDIPFSEFPLFMEPLRRQSHFQAIITQLPPSSTKEILVEQDIKSILVLPVIADNQFCGFIGFDDCHKERTWSEDEFQLLDNLTSNLAHIIKETWSHQRLLESEGRFKSLVQNATDLIAIIDEFGYYKYVAPSSTKVLGMPPEDFIGKNAFEFIHKDDAPRVEQQLKEVIENNEVFIEAFRFTDAKGNWRWVQTHISNHISDPTINGIIANTREVTAEVRKKKVDDLLKSLTRAIGQPGPIKSCFTEALGLILELPKILIGEIWLTSKGATRLDLIANEFNDPSFNKFYEESTAVNSFKKGIGLPGQVWNQNSALVWPNLPSDNRFLRAKAAGAVNIHTAIGLPITHNDEFLGCIICFTQCPELELTSETDLLTDVCRQLGAVIKQKVTEEEYRNFFDISPDPHCILGFDGRIKKFNKSFQKLLEYEEGKLLETPILQLIHEKDKQEAENQLRSSITGKRTESFEVRFLSRSGETKWLVWSGTVLPESKIIIAVAKEITEQKIAEQELQIAYDRLKNAQKIGKLGYWIRDFDSEVSVWGEETYKIYEYDPADFIPTIDNVAKTFLAEDRYLIESDPRELLDPDEIQSFEHRILTGTGKVKWVRQEIRLLTDENGVPFRIEGTTQDITQRKEFEENLAISNERFKLAMQASNEMIWEVDHRKNIITRGQGYEQTFDYDTSETFSKDNSWFSKIHPEDRNSVWESLLEFMQDKDKSHWSSEYKVQSVDGSIAYFMDRCHILRDEQGNPVRSVGSSLNVTSSRLQLKRIQKQNEIFREIAWLQSHVIRAPLSRIMGLIYLANELDEEELSLDEILKMISDSAQELDEVIREITEKTNAIENEDTTDNL